MTYDELVTRLQQWAENDDSEFTGTFDHIIDLAEQRISKDLNCDAMRVLKTNGTVTNGSATLDLPSDCVAVRWIGVVVSSSLKPLWRRELSFLRDYSPNPVTTGRPLYYALQDADTVYFAPTPDQAYAYHLDYEARITGLSSGTQTTWLSLNQPDLLFYACLLEVAAYEKAADDEQRYTALYKAALDSAVAEVARVRSDANSLHR